MRDKSLISIIIPNYNGADTLKQCLSAATSLSDEAYEVIVVDDGSEDNSVEIIKDFPCHLIELEKHSGASQARNTGAKNSQGEVLFFTDSDCLVLDNSLDEIRRSLAGHPEENVIGGTYTLQPYDGRFFSRFQSIFIHYSETKHLSSPDYLASHALVISTTTFHKIGGFAEDFLPILEDVEFSHRLRHSGKQLIIDPAIQVQHIFNYSLIKSLRNAFRKSRYWAMYSLKNQDLLTDSGTASHELKVNVACFYLSLLFIGISAVTGSKSILLGIAILMVSNLVLSRKLLRQFYDANGSLFALAASLYYLLVYPLPVGVGAMVGIANPIQTKGHT